MQIALLGEVRVSTTDGSTRRVGGPRVRLLLALLAIEPGRPVRSASLIDAIWGDSPPADPANALQTLVKRLRAQLPPAVTVRYLTGGYQLRAAVDDIDVHRFIRITGAGIDQLETGAAGSAARTLDAALGIWRGPALADLADVPDLCWSADRWNELRLDAVEARADAYLMLGRGRELAASLEHEFRQQPLRESLAARLIRVLVVGGQLNRAREVFADTRRLLSTELGVAPSPELMRAAAEISWEPSRFGPRTGARRTHGGRPAEPAVPGDHVAALDAVTARIGGRDVLLLGSQTDRSLVEFGGRHFRRLESIQVFALEPAPPSSSAAAAAGRHCQRAARTRTNSTAHGYPDPSKVSDK